MSDSWDDFESVPTRNQTGIDDKCSHGQQNSSPRGLENKDSGCSWGQLEADDRPSAAASYGKQTERNSTDAQDFITTYEKYLTDKKSIPQQTTNYKTYSREPQKFLHEWFEYEGHDELVPNTILESEGQYVSSIDLPVDEHDFTLTSECYPKKKDALDEVCLDACRLLDACGMLSVSLSINQGCGEGEDPDRKRRIDEANKEDDIEFDSTLKRHCNDTSISRPSTTDNKVNTYQSLMAKWTVVNMSILQLKSQLVKLDLSVSKEVQTRDKPSKQLNENEDDEEEDPLDAFMSNLTTKTELSRDEKIEKSRLKTQIEAQEKELSKLSRMVELAKPASSKQL